MSKAKYERGMKRAAEYRRIARGIELRFEMVRDGGELARDEAAFMLAQLQHAESMADEAERYAQYALEGS